MYIQVLGENIDVKSKKKITNYVILAKKKNL